MEKSSLELTFIISGWKMICGRIPIGNELGRPSKPTKGPLERLDIHPLRIPRVIPGTIAEVRQQLLEGTLSSGACPA